MHDTNLDERLRSVLRQEGDSLPFTITTDELERRLLLRRRERNGRRLSLMAAGLAAVAVGAIFALSNGWLANAPVVGTDATPSPRPTTSAVPSGTPAPTGTPAPSATARAANPIGEAGQAVLVTPTGASSQRPDTFEVTVLDPATLESVPLATIPGSVIPEDGRLEHDDGPPEISATGWLAIPFTRGPSEDASTPAIAIIDTRAPEGDPWILDGYTSMSWDMTDKLVVADDQGIAIAWPISRFLQPFAVQGPSATIASNSPQFTTGPAITTDDSTRFLATSTDEAQSWGYVGFDGVFTATTDLPPVYQRFGSERPTGAAAHGLGQACDSGPDAASSGCYLIESNEKHEPLETWLDIDQAPELFDFAWAADGKSVWMLLDGRTTDGGQVASFAYAAKPGARVELARISYANGVHPVILGFADERVAGIATVAAIGDTEGRIRAFILDNRTVAAQDGTAWFAGWAADPPAYDPD